MMASEVKEESNSTPSDVKNDVEDEEMKDADSKMKDGDKDILKNESKEESGKEGSDEENEDDEDEDEEEVALLDRPVVMTGCRARKKVERLEMTFSTPKDKQEIPEGKGKKLGDCPRIEVQIQKIKVVDLKPLHKILFNRTGSANEIKKNIRKFSGFPFDKDSAEYARKKASVDKMTASVLKKVCLILDIERGGTKEDIVNRIMTFLLNPEDSGKKVPSSKKKASKDKKKNTSKKAKSEKKGKAEKNDHSDEEPEESEDDDSTGGEASMGGTDEENEDANDASDEEPKKKSKETKSSKAKSKADKVKKEEKKTKGTKRKHDEDEDDEDDDSSASSSDEQPPAKKSKMPSDEEISKLVKHILESADLQEITMKKVIKQVSDAYPDFDLSHKKAFIKSTIKSVIS